MPLNLESTICRLLVFGNALLYSDLCVIVKKLAKKVVKYLEDGNRLPYLCSRNQELLVSSEGLGKWGVKIEFQ